MSYIVNQKNDKNLPFSIT